jgi:hemerythrin
MKNKTVSSEASDNEELVIWSDKYATGIQKIDGQHRHLVTLTNNLYKACLQDSKEAETMFKESMSLMVEYVRFHFSDELKILDRVKFPGLQDHKKQHDTLVKNILEAAKDYNEGLRHVPNSFVRALKDWVFGHIAIYDKIYSAYIMKLNPLFIMKGQGFLTDNDIEGSG